jgi:hypothetical protein
VHEFHQIIKNEDREALEPFIERVLTEITLEDANRLFGGDGYLDYLDLTTLQSIISHWSGFRLGHRTWGFVVIDTLMHVGAVAIVIAALFGIDYLYRHFA